ncbi:MAG: AMP-binding protein [Pontibacterium sp.]
MKYTNSIDPASQSLAGWIHHLASHYKHRSAFTAQNTTLSYERVNDHASHFAAYLQSLPQLSAGDRVAVSLPNCLQYPVVSFGLWKAGLVMVNTHAVPSDSKLNEQLQQSGAKVLIVSEDYGEYVDALVANTSVERVVFVAETDVLPWPRSLWRHLGAHRLKRWMSHSSTSIHYSFASCLQKGSELTWVPTNINPHSLALIQYTSGATGKAKAVCYSHSGLIANAKQLIAALYSNADHAKEVAVCPLPLGHFFAFSQSLLVLPAIGAHVVFLPDVRDTETVARELVRWPASIFISTNTVLAAITALPHLSRSDFARLKYTVSGISTLTSSTEQSWFRLTPSAVYELYGLTECGVAVTLKASIRDAADLAAPVPLAGVDVHVVNDDGYEALVGESGMLWVKGANMMMGYLGDKGAPERMTEDDGWLATGDIVRVIGEGQVEFVERAQELIKQGNFVLYPTEIERMVASHPEIIDCAAVSVSSDVAPELTAKDNNEQVKLFVVTKNKRMTVKDVRDYARERLTSYKVPPKVEFRASLPRNLLGRVNRAELQAEELSKLHRKRRLV